jgi:hypothetical protein
MIAMTEANPDCGEWLGATSHESPWTQSVNNIDYGPFWPNFIDWLVLTGVSDNAAVSHSIHVW